jgi:type IV pilus assembly protein PilB
VAFRRQRTDSDEPSGSETPADGPGGSAAGAARPPAKPGRVRKGGRNTFDGGDTTALDNQIERWVGNDRPMLGDVLLELGVLEPDALFEALQRQKDTPEGDAKARLGDVLLAMGSVDEKALAAALAHQFGVPLADLTEEEFHPEAVAQVPEDLARKHRVLPVRVDDDGRVFLASAEPLDTAAIEELTRACSSIGLLIGARSDIDRLIDQAYSALRTADEVIRAFELADAPTGAAADGGAMRVDENAPVVQVVNRILTQGVRSRASDIHIEPMRDSVRVRYRVDGAMAEAIRVPARMGPAISSRLKVMAELNIVERRRPQDGQFSLTVDGRPIDVRVSVVPTVEGEKTVLRLLDKSKSLIAMNSLGMIPSVEEPFLRMARQPLGMILCTGPTGSGKTTTLYATLSEVNDPTKNVVTIEDPVEYQFDGVSQMQVADTGMGFAEGLRGILRQDPDVILVGEIRDEETARIAMQAALTGHLVLSSLHAIDSASAVHRFTDMGIEPFLVASAINGVVAQRLVRRLCTACREPVQPSSSDIAMVGEHTEGQLPAVWFRARGCNLCNGTGFRGRIGVYELLEFTERVRELVVNHASHSDLRAAAVEEGMRTMQQQAFMLVVDGVTTVDEVLRSVYAQGGGSDRRAPRALGPGPQALPRAGRRSGDGPDELHAAAEAPGDDEPTTPDDGARVAV